MLKAGRTSLGARAASSHTGALAGNDKIYDDVLRQSGVIRAPGLRDMLEYARAIPVLPTPKGENVVIITGAGGSGVLLSDACVDNKLHADGDAAGSRRRVPQVHPAVRRRRQPGRHHRRRAADDVPEHDQARPRGPAHPRADPRLLAHDHHAADGVRQPGRRGRRRDEGARASTSRSSRRSPATSQVEEAAEYLFQHGIPAYPYSTEMPVAVLGAKYKWARGAGLL